MPEYINKQDILDKVDSLVDKGKYYDKYDYAFRDGNNSALNTIKSYIENMEIKNLS